MYQCGGRTDCLKLLGSFKDTVYSLQRDESRGEAISEVERTFAGGSGSTSCMGLVILRTEAHDAPLGAKSHIGVPRLQAKEVATPGLTAQVREGGAREGHAQRQPC